MNIPDYDLRLDTPDCPACGATRKPFGPRPTCVQCLATYLGLLHLLGFHRGQSSTQYTHSDRWVSVEMDAPSRSRLSAMRPAKDGS